MFRKILIANRGEIAARIIKTCKRMGIQTVAIYSKADEENPYVRMADEAYCIGTAQAKDSYLKGDEIIALAKSTGAEAIHPGFGFLSENDAFVRGCMKEGIVFIGPNPDVMLAMGGKIQSRETMAQHGVPVIKGSKGALKSEEEAVAAAEGIGFPVMVKASGGGGGIGMEVANTIEEVKKAYTKCKSRATVSFGDGTVYMEKYLPEPRHIEIQVIADKHGNVWHLGERDCSTQRRHQKVIEESPSVALTPELRAQMCETAVQAATVIGYDSVGTVEMLVDRDKNAYFLEVNTRIQVEHGVTEMQNGIDLIELMIRIAAGEEVKPVAHNPKGHTIECRLYAEDPYTFFPSCGVLTEVNFPEGEGIRYDHSIETGQKITLFYDPMIAKVLVHTEDRASCIKKMRETLDALTVEGVKTNIPFMQRVLADEEFACKGATTHLADRINEDMKMLKKVSKKGVHENGDY